VACPNYGAFYSSCQIPILILPQVIRETFLPYTSSSNPIPEGLIRDLLYRFSSSEGYRTRPGALGFFRALRHRKRRAVDVKKEPDVTVGIITNSDDRVPSILSSLGISVRPLRCGKTLETSDPVTSPQSDISFVTLSYDAGFEKPDRRIFDAAKELIQREQDVEYDFLHVGDDLEKDVRGALAADWRSILLDWDREHVDANVERVEDLRELRLRLGL